MFFLNPGFSSNELPAKGFNFIGAKEQNRETKKNREEVNLNSLIG